ncbi:MAG: hypothetical protein ACE37K_23935 [Planctomycetota bacterium]
MATGRKTGEKGTADTPGGSHLPLTLVQVAGYLLPGVELKQFLLWPPDLFALTSMSLDVSGAYIAAVADRLDLDPERGFLSRAWREQVEQAAAQWRSNLEVAVVSQFLLHRRQARPLGRTVAGRMKQFVPDLVEQLWKALRKVVTPLDQTKGGHTESISKLNHEPKLAKAREAVLTLHAIADSACAGWGVAVAADSEDDDTPDPAGHIVRQHLRDFHTLSSIHADRGVVLPKLHTSQVGMTLRSLSLHLSFHRTSMPIKLVEHEVETRAPMNVLLLPWPLETRALDFKKVRRDPVVREGFGYFSYEPRSMEMLAKLDEVLQNARRECGGVDMVVFPECAIAETSLHEFEKVMQAHDVGCYIAGVHKPPGEDGQLGENLAVVKTGGAGRAAFANSLCRQHKHHRWRLDASQIVAYQLGGILDLDEKWWEAIRIHERSVSFVSLGPDITLCPLICEDLARQEPVSEILRSFGPSLVVSLLMDGPQYRSRWSAQYASVLADDPGSSVLTLTSLGMVKRWRSPFLERRPIVALWKDSYGPAVEIPLEDDKYGVLLTLSARRNSEYSADGRRADGRVTITLGGWQSV